LQKSPVVIIWAALAVAAVTGIAIAPKIIGLSVIDSLNAHVAQINDIPPYTAMVKEVNSGWFNSSAVIAVSVSFPEMDAEQQQTFTFDLNFNAQHGPVLMGESLTFGREAWSLSYQGENLRSNLDFAPDQAFYEFKAKTDLLGSTAISDHIVPFNIQTTEDDEPVSLSFSGYQGSGDIHGNNITYMANIDKVSIDGSGKQANIDNIHVDSQLKANMEQIFSGEMYDSLVKVSIAKMSFTDSEDPSLNSNIQNTLLSGESVADRSKKIFHILSSYSVERYEVMGSVGQDLRLNVDMKNLSSDFIKAYQKQIQNTVQVPQGDPNAVQQQLLDFMDTNLLDLLIASPEFNIAQVSGKLEQGKFNGQLFTKLVNITHLPDNLLDNTFWLSHLQASTHIEIEQSVAEMIAVLVLESQLKANPELAQATPEQINEIAMQQAPMMLQNLEQQGLLEATAEGYQLVAELKDSQANINGNPIPLPIP
jgi:uncharacterized protein YdgA (DUF945 family)